MKSQEMQSDYRICTMPDGKWFASSLDYLLEGKAVEAGGELTGYDLGEMLELFGVKVNEDADDPVDKLLTAIETDPQHTEMLEQIKKLLNQ